VRRRRSSIERAAVLGLYLLGVVSAAVVAAGSAVRVGLENRRPRRRPRLFLVAPSEDSGRLTALDRALDNELRRRARGGRPRRQTG
jgi:hypothetical protein